ncbi:conjugal transfer protein TraD [Mesorhizobium sp. ES1-3]|uniref:conjugal transfer protein TraD n=1 Tax=Mesorhizobium sp. ES1-3 TaxID=2876628 RepID=UPI001CCC5789|nr:conjugal transfer protein TraD [Mesorhizobium sp. ES1-3]MBZ9674051.1 conjugal transfer protein TraD [Mesorhizobium sp. ES1-3]
MTGTSEVRAELASFARATHFISTKVQFLRIGWGASEIGAAGQHQAVKARNDMRTWQVERRKRTRHLIELGGLLVKAGIVDLTGDDRTTINGALLWMGDKFRSEQGEQARMLWAQKGKEAFEADRKGGPSIVAQEQRGRE